MPKLRTAMIRAYRWGTLPLRWTYQARYRRTESFPIAALFYHRVADRNPTPWTISNVGFQQQIDWISKRFEMISLQEAQTRIESGHSPRPACCITFDDGYAENHDYALPYLLRKQIPFTYFVALDYLSNGSAFPHDTELGLNLPRDCEQSIRSLSQCGVDIGCHTRTHIDFSSPVTDAQLEDEIVTATKELEAIVGRQIHYLAVPYGQLEHMDQRVFEKAAALGLNGVCSAYGGLNRTSQNPFHLQRIHGDPNFERMKNWLSWDPRIVNRPNPLDKTLARLSLRTAETATMNEETSSSQQDSNQPVCF